MPRVRSTLESEALARAASTEAEVSPLWGAASRAQVEDTTNREPARSGRA